MMHEGEKSDSAIVAKKLANKAEQSAAEPVERRVGAEENASQDGTLRTPSRVGVSSGLDRVRTAARLDKKWPSERFAVTYPRWEPYALIGHVRI
jgi:RNA-directed DNA polymerase